jgi:hypothetical protein
MSPDTSPPGDGSRFAVYQLRTPDYDHHRDRALEMIEAIGGRAVAHLVEHAPPATTWTQRPVARALLDSLALGPARRGFDAVLIPDPPSALYRAQSTTIPVIFAYRRVPLWTPVTAGPIDPANKLHTLLLVRATYCGCALSPEGRR